MAKEISKEDLYQYLIEENHTITEAEKHFKATYAEIKVCLDRYDISRFKERYSS